MTRCYDVLVIGAGPAGAAAATHAARSGLSVALIDRSRFPRNKTCGDALSNLALQELSDLGVREPLESQGAAVRGAVAVFPNGYAVSRDYGDLPGRILPRLQLDAAIVERAVSAGVELLEGQHVEHIDLAAQEQRLKTRASAHGSAGLTLRGRAVIAADGPGSVARRALGLEHPAERHLGVAATAYFSGVRLREDHVSEHYFSKSLPHGYFWAFPATAGQSNVGVYQRTDSFKQSGRKLKSLLQEFIAHNPQGFEGAEQQGNLNSWQLPLSSWQLPPSGRGILCCGDAAGSVDSLTGEGIYQALFSGRLAAESCALALEEAGQVTAEHARRYQHQLARRISFPQAARSYIQQALAHVVDHELERFGWMQRLLELGYGGGRLEVTKRVN
ncbi:MAG: geranylgeranyl reductase family protein [Polyangiaceae bacterium]